ncbi:MAG: hypothetical protein E6R03_10375 [Hyphomicrobiaceae bacterium]|nr:MAG: hypothetical protein E6R03_10375 [Hyphomicrobiaceae bacterium]
MNSHIAVAWALGILGGAMFVTGLVLPKTRKAPIMPPSEGGGETLESVPASLDDVLDLSGKVTGNVATSNVTTGNFVVSTNLTIQKHKNVTLYADLFETITIPGHHVITQAEAEEVVRALEQVTEYADAVFTEKMLWWFAGSADAPAKTIREARENLEAMRSALAKWRKRVEEGKP